MEWDKSTWWWRHVWANQQGSQLREQADSREQVSRSCPLSNHTWHKDNHSCLLEILNGALQKPKVTLPPWPKQNKSSEDETCLVSVYSWNRSKSWSLSRVLCCCFDFQSATEHIKQLNARISSHFHFLPVRPCQKIPTTMTLTMMMVWWWLWSFPSCHRPWRLQSSTISDLCLLQCCTRWVLSSWTYLVS